MTRLANCVEEGAPMEIGDQRVLPQWPYSVLPGLPPYEMPRYVDAESSSETMSPPHVAAARLARSTHREILRDWNSSHPVYSCSHQGCTARLRLHCNTCSKYQPTGLRKVFGWTATKSLGTLVPSSRRQVMAQGCARS